MVPEILGLLGILSPVFIIIILITIKKVKYYVASSNHSKCLQSSEFPSELVPDGAQFLSLLNIFSSSHRFEKTFRGANSSRYPPIRRWLPNEVPGQLSRNEDTLKG